MLEILSLCERKFGVSFLQAEGSRTVFSENILFMFNKITIIIIIMT